MSDSETAEQGTTSSDVPSTSNIVQASSTMNILPGIKPPGKLDIQNNMADNWKTYKQGWENYAIITNLNSQPEAYQVALFLHCVGPDALKIYNGLDFANAEDGKSLKKIFEMFDLHTIGEINEIYERYIFNCRNQQPDESVDAYVTALRNLSKTCNFCDCLKDSLLRDRIVLGIQSQQTRKRLLQDRKLTLKKCIDMCRSIEAASSQLKNIAQDNPSIESVRMVGQRSRKQQRNRPPHFQKIPPNSRMPCQYCGTEHPAIKEQCPAWGKSCLSCGVRNHFARVCRKAKSTDIRAMKEHDGEDTEKDDDNDVEYVTSVTLVHDNIYSVSETNTSHFASEIYAELLITNQPIKFQIDCGATINVLPEGYVKGCDLKPTSKRLRMWNNSEVIPLGTTRVITRNPRNNKRYSIEFVVVRENLVPIIGARAAQHMNMITIHNDSFTSTKPGKMSPPEVNSLSTTEQVFLQYPDVFDCPLGTLAGEVHLEVDTEVRPVVTPSRRVPAALRSKFKDELDRLQKLGVITPVSEPTPWVNSVAIATKKSGGIRVCIDPRPLNTALQRERHQMVILDEILPELSKAKLFSSVDLRSGYWHCPLDTESSMLTTFSTPHGRYRWLRLPFGLCVSSKIFQKQVNQALDGLDGIVNIADDILVYGVGETTEDAEKDHDTKLVNLLDRCKERGIALNPDKLKLKMEEVAFMGHILTNKGVKIDPEKVKAIVEMPAPTSVEEVQRLNGFVNYLSKFLPQLATVMDPIRKLTRKDTPWEWFEQQQQAFEAVKKLATESPVLRYYDPDQELQVQCDASQRGLGAALLQKGKPIAYTSRALTETEERYAQIEKEMLAIVFSLEKFHHHTYGRPVKVFSDHKPLEMIFKKPLATIPRRLQGMRMRLQAYDIEVIYQPGPTMYIADMLSRSYLPITPDPSSVEFENINMAQFLPISSDRLTEIKVETASDEALQLLKETILHGWPDIKHELPPQVYPYFSTRDELSTQDGLIFRGERVVVPTKLRRDMKNKLHSSHMGAESCLRRARECLFWPGMSAEIRQLVEHCETCAKFSTSQQKETLMSHELPSRPWQKVGVDLFECNKKDYLVTVDYFSNYWEVDRLNNSTTATVVIEKLKTHFARYGSPETLISDNGPQFASAEFAQFSKTWDFEHRTSSPEHPQSNGMAESAVKTAKRLLQKAAVADTDFQLALLDYRNTPSQGMDLSPMQRFMHRRSRTLLPATTNLLEPCITPRETQQSKLMKKQNTQAKYYNRTAKDLSKLSTGDVVRMKPTRLGQREWRKAKVTSRHDNRSYLVETEDGGKYRRNRVHLRKSKEPFSADDEPPYDTTPDDETNSNEGTGNPETELEPQGLQALPNRPQRMRKPPNYLKDYDCM